MKLNNHQKSSLDKARLLITGGAGFIGSNLVEFFLNQNCLVTCLDNFSTGHHHNIAPFINHENFTLIEGDIRNLETCRKAAKNQDYILHQAALGSVPRSIENPVLTNHVNIGGFLNMLVAAKDEGVKRFIYAASSSTYGDSERLPKVEDKIGSPMSPYAITKYVNELYAANFKTLYNLDSIGLRYFNVFGRRQDSNSTYAAVIPKFVNKFMTHESPVINGAGDYSRDFTYIDNVVLMNMLCLTTPNTEALNQIYNTACGARTSIKDMTNYIQEYLAEFDKGISNINIEYGPIRDGDVPHSLASIDKAEKLLGYKPSHTFKEGLKEAISWYWSNLKQNANA